MHFIHKIEDKVSFLVLCPELNIGGLRSTISSIKSNFPKNDYMCVLGENANDIDMCEILKITPVMKGGNTITSLMNNGIKQSKKEWVYIIVAGVMLRPTIFRKYETFLTNETDIMYQITNKTTWLFPDATINGILINKKAIKEVGDFPDEENIVNSKLVWGATALEKGFKFRGLVGVKL
jgi:hypothetical protein